MSDMAALHSFLSASRPDDGVIGWRDGDCIRQDAFRTRIRHWRALLTQAKGDRFALYIADSIEFASALLGAWQAGKRIYLPADTLAATCQALSGEVDGFLGEFDAQWWPLRPAADATADNTPFKELPRDFLGLVVYTSGSTGAPQAIPKHLFQLSAEVETLEHLFGAALGKADVAATVSHQHIYGLLFKVLWPLTAGRAIHARSLEFPEQLAQLMERHAYVLVSSPAHLKRLPDTPAWAAVAVQLQAIFSSGGPLSPEVGEETARLLRHTPIEVYGSSETGGIAWRKRRTPVDESWIPMRGVAWRSGEDGVLEVRSAHLPDDGWFAMADRAVATEEGRFALRGRVDRIVKIEEKRISLTSIESALAASPLVEQARVAVAGEVAGRRQRIAAFVVLSQEGRTVLQKSGKLAVNRLLADALTGTVERIALPRSWRYLDALPLNAQGKTTQADLLALLEDEAESASQPVIDRPKLPRSRLIEKTESHALFELTSPPDLFYFDGHFNEAPILPGVVQVDWAIACGRQCFDLPPVFKAIHALKFQRVIEPEVPVTLELVHEPHKSSLTFRMSSRDGQHASGRILFGAHDV
jgi:acyl-coenzyme A synthetase/AMP-(fatty) acid ligase